MIILLIDYFRLTIETWGEISQAENANRENKRLAEDLQELFAGENNYLVAKIAKRGPS